MPTVYFVRHGQASLGAKNYDNLSSLGQKQSHLLGKHFSDQGLKFDRIIIGGLNRHRQTLDSFLSGAQKEEWNRKSVEVLQALNEYDHVELYNAYSKENNNLNTSFTDARSYFKTMQEALIAWSEGEIFSPLSETWVEFENRVLQSLRNIVEHSSEKDKVLVISSGGTMCCAIMHALGISKKICIDLNMQTRNTSYSQFYISENSLILESFNNIPHLEKIEHLDKVTYS